MGGMGGMGNLNATGLGAFLGAGVDPVYDPVMIQGLQVTEQAITHVAGNWHTEGAKNLSFSSPDNLQLWADWVRASLYLTDYLTDLRWTVNDGPDEDEGGIALTYGGPTHTFYTVQRPHIRCFEEQLKFMRDYIDQRPDRAPEIMSQLGFPTPYFTMILGLQPVANRYTLELIGITQVVAAHTAMVVKHHLACRRPDRLGAKVMPIIPTPAHATFPSAHATEAFAVATVLNKLIASQKHYPDVKKRQALITKLAERIAVNRTVAGVHYPIDSWAGAILGRAVGQIVLSKCHAPHPVVHAYEYCAHGHCDFFVDQFVKGPNPPFGVHPKGDIHVAQSELFEWLWNKTLKEFDLSQ
jgi:membrane-associated phospholipid phosphatase